MAQATMASSSLRLVFHDGDDPETGSAILKAKAFNHVKTDATVDQLFDVAQAMGDLQELPLVNIERRDNTEITADEPEDEEEDEEDKEDEEDEEE